MLSLQCCRTTDPAAPWRWVVRLLPQVEPVSELDDDLAAVLGMVEGRGGRIDYLWLDALLSEDDLPSPAAEDALDDASRCLSRALRRERSGDPEGARQWAIRCAVHVQAVRQIAARERCP